MLDSDPLSVQDEIHHVPSSKAEVDGKSNIAVIGGGISTAHKVLEMVRERSSSTRSSDGIIYLISRHSLREQQFDTHQDWMMDNAACKRSLENGGSGKPSRQRAFSATSCMKERRSIIQNERIAGTVTPEVHRGTNGLRYAIESGDVAWKQTEVVSCSRQPFVDANGLEHSFLQLGLANGEAINVDKVILATGFGKRLPGGSLIESKLVKRAKLMVSRWDGFPIVNEFLAWHKRIYVSGALAELELGPSARNIAGARLSAERIASALVHESRR